MNNNYNINEFQNDMETIKNLNKNLQERIEDLNYVIGNLKLEYPTMLIYQNGNIYLNKNFDFEKTFVQKEEVIELVNLLKELSKEVVDNELRLETANEATTEMNKKDDE